MYFRSDAWMTPEMEVYLHNCRTEENFEHYKLFNDISVKIVHSSYSRPNGNTFYS